jgi:transposase InsO family protein
MKEKDLIKHLEEENSRLKIALAESQLARHALESLVEVIDEHYQTDVKKKLRTSAIARCATKKEANVSSLCKYYGLSRNGYYKSINKDITEELSESLIAEMVQEERRYQPRIGGKKLYHMYKDSIHKIDPGCGRDKFFDILRANDLLVERKHSSTRTTNSYHRFYTHKNLIKDIEVTHPNQVWVSDITYIRAGSGFAYLSLITDKYSRKILGWHLSESLGIDGCITSLKKAMSSSKVLEGIIHHSDRGIQYCSNPYTDLLKKHKILISMTEENHCYENGLAERVNGILKNEYMLDACFVDFKQAKLACKQAIEMYNNRRPHWALNFKTPQEVHEEAA